MTFLAPQAITVSRRFEKPRENKLLCASIMKKSYERRNKSRYKKISGFWAPRNTRTIRRCVKSARRDRQRDPKNFGDLRSCNDIREPKRISRILVWEYICAFPNKLLLRISNFSSQSRFRAWLYRQTRGTFVERLHQWL